MVMMVCPVCGCRMSSVVKTRTYSVYVRGETRYIVRRTRCCRCCGTLFKTSEQNENNPKKTKEQGAD